MSSNISDEQYPPEMEFDEKMRIIRSYACGFWVLEDRNSGNLEGRIDYEGFSMFVGDSPYISEVIDEVFQHVYNEILGDVLWQENDSKL